MAKNLHICHVLVFSFGLVGLLVSSSFRPSFLPSFWSVFCRRDGRGVVPCRAADAAGRRVGVNYFLYYALAYYVAFLYKKKFFAHQCSEIMSKFFFVFSFSIIGFVLTLIIFFNYILFFYSY
jgi:hypothetical protein